MYRHKVPHTTNPFTAPAGKKTKEKIVYCQRHARVMDRWAGQTGELMFRREKELWLGKIHLITAGKL